MNLENTLAYIPNPKAGGVSKEEIEHAKSLEHDRLDVFVPEDKTQARELARNILRKGYGAICPGGGDGTKFLWLNLMIQEAQGRPLPKIVVGKFGTGRSYKHLVGARDDEKQLEMIMDHEFRDLPTLNIPLIGIDFPGEETPFYHSFAGTGWDAQILNRYIEMKDKKIWKFVDGLPYAGKTLVYGAASLSTTNTEIFRDTNAGNISISSTSNVYKMDKNDHPVLVDQADAFHFDEPIQYAGVGTTPYFGFKFTVMPFALKAHNFTPQRMHLRVATGKPWKLIPEVLTHLWSAWKGTYRSDNIHDFLVEDAQITFQDPEPVQIAGESKGKKTGFATEVSGYKAHLVDFNRM